MAAKLAWVRSQNRGLHVEFLPADQIELAELRLQHGLEIALQIAAEGAQRFGHRIRQATRQVIQTIRIDESS